MASSLFLPFKSGARIFFFLFFWLLIPEAASACKSLSPEENKIVKIVVLSSGHSPSPALIIFKRHIKDSRRVIAACLAFPLPVGFLGVHRIFLGTKPYVPVVYAATLGGCLGIIPFVDFCVILFTPDLEQYLGNPRIFMWVK